MDDKILIAAFERLQAQEAWTENVREYPKAYNFVVPGDCTSTYHDQTFCGGLLNAYGRCEACQDVFASEMQAAEERAWGRGW